MIKEEEFQISIQEEKDTFGNIVKWTEETRDGDTLIRKRVDEYTYYNTGEVDTITQKVFDGEGNLVSEKRVKHFRDSRPPVVEE